MLRTLSVNFLSCTNTHRSTYPAQAFAALEMVVLKSPFDSGVRSTTLSMCSSAVDKGIRFVTRNGGSGSRSAIRSVCRSGSNWFLNNWYFDIGQAFTSARELIRFFWKGGDEIQIDGCSDSEMPVQPGSSAEVKARVRQQVYGSGAQAGGWWRGAAMKVAGVPRSRSG
jgi:hypothetical protein